jgi:pilus assembly protein CpaD
MKPLRSLLLASTLLMLPGCQPPAADYTTAEWPKALVLDDATGSIALHFAPGSARLRPADRARLRHLAAIGEVAPSDRVLVAAGGVPTLSNARVAALSGELMRYGIAPIAAPLAGVPPDGAVIERVRYTVTLPPCPNWSKAPNRDFANTIDSNFGCATAVNLGRMIASPADLALGRPLGPAPALNAVSALGRYYADRVYLAPSNSLITSLGNANQIPPGAQTPQGLSPMFTEVAPTRNPIAAGGAGGGPTAGGAEVVTRPAVPAPVPPGSAPPPER